MKRIEFRLSMPHVNTWNGRWSGEERNYTIVRNLTEHAIRDLLGDKPSVSLGYNFGDGWFARVVARIVPSGERLKKSDGFCGYDWMVTDILDHGFIGDVVKPVAG